MSHATGICYVVPNATDTQLSVIICDLFCINQPFATNLSFEKNSCIDFELSLLIDYTSYHYEIFSASSTEQDFYRD